MECLSIVICAHIHTKYYTLFIAMNRYSYIPYILWNRAFNTDTPLSECTPDPEIPVAQGTTRSRDVNVLPTFTKKPNNSTKSLYTLEYRVYHFSRTPLRYHRVSRIYMWSRILDYISYYPSLNTAYRGSYTSFKAINFCSRVNPPYSNGSMDRMYSRMYP